MAAPVRRIVKKVAPTVGVYREINSLGDFAAAASEIATEGRKIWFRGARDVKHDLKPGLFRHPSITDAARLIELEWQLLSDYRHQAPPFAGLMPDDDLTLMFFMQHYRVPTRLLDWTENPFIALFFAIENARDELAGTEKDSNVWLLDPVGLNARTFPNQPDSERILSAPDVTAAQMGPSPRADAIKTATPCALYGVHNSPRIVAQRGSFVLYGKNTLSMEDQASLNLGKDGILRRMVVKGKAKREIFDHLFNMGISDSVVYPDLDGLSREIRNRRGFVK